jgi:hydroxymethylglutaryl-CoA lyase
MRLKFVRPGLLQQLLKRRKAFIEGYAGRIPFANLTSTTEKVVRLVEVGPRDGLQTERPLSVNDRVELVRRLAVDAGLRNIEVGSFVSERRVPQLANTAQVVERLNELISEEIRQKARFPVLVPNEKYLEEALRANCHQLAVFVSATEGFSERNLGCSIRESLQRVEGLFRRLERESDSNSFSVRGYVSCVFVCPFEGSVHPMSVWKVANTLFEIGCSEVSLGDTVGMGTPPAVRRLFDELLGRSPSTDGKYAVHFHDTYGMAIANILCAIEEYNVSVVDSSVGGLGGCPFAPGSTGNVATEDVLYLLQSLDRAEDGIDLMKLVQIGAWINEKLGRETRSKVGRAMLQRQTV